MTNYTRPNDPTHEDSPKDWLQSALVFAAALGILLKENEGVVVELAGDAIGLCETKKVVIYNKGHQIKVTELEEDLPEGQLVWMHETEEDRTNIN